MELRWCRYRQQKGVGRRSAAEPAEPPPRCTARQGGGDRQLAAAGWWLHMGRSRKKKVGGRVSIPVLGGRCVVTMAPHHRVPSFTLPPQIDDGRIRTCEPYGYSANNGAHYLLRRHLVPGLGRGEGTVGCPRPSPLPFFSPFLSRAPKCGLPASAPAACGLARASCNFKAAVT